MGPAQAAWMDAEAQIESFIAKFSDEVAAKIRTLRAAMCARLPGLLELVYDNYNALAIGYGTTDRVSDVVFSLACYPKRVNLVFFRGADLDDPKGLLFGEGSQVRSIRISDPGLLDDPDIRALWDQALANSAPPSKPVQSRTIVKSISAKQRSRRPT